MSGQPQLPEAFRSGDQLYAADLQRINDAVAFALDSMIVGGDGIFVQKVAGRYIFSRSRDRNTTATASSLQITRRQQPGNTDESTDGRFYITWGTINNLIPDNIHSGFDMPAANASAWVYLRANISEASPYFVESATIQIEPSLTNGPAFASDGTWPAYILIAIGRIEWLSSISAHRILLGGNGSISLAIYAHSWSCSATGPRLRFGVNWNRLAP